MAQTSAHESLSLSPAAWVTVQPMNSASQPHELGLQVTPEDIDELGHVNNVNYLRWVQKAATSHWNLLAPEKDRERIAWVVLRHEIDYKRPALAGEIIIARTWVGVASRLSFERHTEILRGSDRELLARARTLWCPVNPQSLRPTQVSPAVRALFSAEPPEATPA